MKSQKIGWRSIDNERGQSLIELGMIIFMFFTMIVGMMEFSRVWWASNMIVNAARAGARAASVSASRGANGVLANSSTIETLVSQDIAYSLGADGGGLTPTVSQACTGCLATVSVNIVGSVPLITSLFGSSFDVDQTVTFNDEGASCGC